MNYRIAHLVLRHPNLKQGDHAFKSVLLVLACHADVDGIASPGFDTLIEESCLSRGTVSQTLRTLEECGYFTKAKGGGKGNSSSYQLHVQQGTAIPRAAKLFTDKTFSSETVQQVNSLNSSAGEQLGESNCSISALQTVQSHACENAPSKEEEFNGRKYSKRRINSSGGGGTHTQARGTPPPQQPLRQPQRMFRDLDEIGQTVVEVWGIDVIAPSGRDVESFERAVMVFKKANAPPDEIRRYYLGCYGPGRNPPKLSQVPSTFNVWLARNQPESQNGTHHNGHAPRSLRADRDAILARAVANKLSLNGG